MKPFLNFLFIIVCTLVVSSCVSQNRFKRINERVIVAEKDKELAEEKFNSLSSEREKLINQNNSLLIENEKLRKDSTERGDYQRKMIRNYSILNESYEKLLKNQDRIQSFSNEELSKREKELLVAEKKASDHERKVNDLSVELKVREEKVKSLEQILSSKELAVNQLKQSVSNALINFKEKDLTVTQKNGKVYVSLSEQLLFKSGSTVLDNKGIEPLKKLANSIKSQPDITITVEGHTDDVKISKSASGLVKDNWDLSVLRATAITKILVDSGVNPSNVIPSGRAEYFPLENNLSPDSRQKNRRTDIILTPKLDELFKILEH